MNQSELLLKEIDSGLFDFATKRWVRLLGYLDSNLKKELELKILCITKKYSTKQEVAEAITDAITKGEIDLSIYATKKFVEDKGYLTEHQKLKTINKEAITGTGNILIESGLSESEVKELIDVKLYSEQYIKEGLLKFKTINGLEVTGEGNILIGSPGYNDLQIKLDINNINKNIEQLLNTTKFIDVSVLFDRLTYVVSKNFPYSITDFVKCNLYVEYRGQIVICKPYLDSSSHSLYFDSYSQDKIIIRHSINLKENDDGIYSTNYQELIIPIGIDERLNTFSPRVVANWVIADEFNKVNKNIFDIQGNVYNNYVTLEMFNSLVAKVNAISGNEQESITISKINYSYRHGEEENTYIIDIQLELSNGTFVGINNYEITYTIHPSSIQYIDITKVGNSYKATLKKDPKTSLLAIILQIKDGQTTVQQSIILQNLNYTQPSLPEDNNHGVFVLGESMLGSNDTLS